MSRSCIWKNYYLSETFLVALEIRSFRLSTTKHSLPCHIGPNMTLEDEKQAIESSAYGGSETSEDCLEEDVSAFPDGGWKAWFVVLGTWCALVPTYGLMNVTGLLEARLAQHELREYSKASVSWIFSLWFFFYYAGGVQIGESTFTLHIWAHSNIILQARYLTSMVFESQSFPVLSGRRYPLCYLVSRKARKHGISCGNYLPTKSNPEYYQFILSFSVLGGLSGSCLLTPGFGCINHWFYKRRGFATGIACTGGGIGGIIFSPLTGLGNTIGFPWMARTLGFVSMAFFIASVLLLKTRLPPNPRARVHIDVRALADPVFSLTSLGVCMAEVGLLIVTVYLPSFAIAHGVRGAMSYNIISIFNATSIIGRIISGFLADPWGRFNVMISTTWVCIALACGLWLTAGDNEAAIISFVALFGFWSAPSISLTPVCVAQICFTEDYGKRYGTTIFLVAVATLVTVPIAGEILGSQNPSGEDKDYSGLILFCGASYACCSFFLIVVRILRVGWRLTKVF